MQRLFPVVSGASAADDVDLVEAYAYPSSGTWLRANMVTSTDGEIAAGDGLSAGLSGPADKRLFGALRRLADVVMVGAGTAKAEGYRPAALPIALVSSRLSLDLDGPLFTAATHRTIVLTSEAAPADRRRQAHERADVVICGDDTVDLTQAVQALVDRGHRKLLTEGGPTLLGSLLAASGLDELCLTTAPLLVAGSGPGLLGAVELPAPARLELTDLFTEDGFLFHRLAVRH